MTVATKLGGLKKCMTYFAGVPPAVRSKVHIEGVVGLSEVSNPA